MSTKYAFFHKKNGVLLGSALFQNTPTGEDFGVKGAVVVKVALNFEGIPCKYNFESKKIENITYEESDTLIKEASLSVRDSKLKELENKYNEAQHLIIKNGHTFKMPLRNAEGYTLFKEKVAIATAYGSASLKWRDLQTNTDKVLELPKEIWQQVGAKAEKVSFSNWDKYSNLKNQISNTDLTDEEIEAITISFPAVETLEIPDVTNEANEETTISTSAVETPNSPAL